MRLATSVLLLLGAPTHDRAKPSHIGVGGQLRGGEASDDAPRDFEAIHREELTQQMTLVGLWEGKG